MRKVGIIIISILLVLSVSASGIGYYYSNNKAENEKTENNNDTENDNEISDETENDVPTVMADEELKEYFNKVGKNYDKIYTSENIKLEEYFNFDKETEKLFMDNFIINNLESFDFINSGLKEYKNSDLINNWLFAYIVKNKNIKEACFSKELLTNAYEKIFNIENVDIKKLFNDNEITDNYVCYSKKNSDVKEYNYKEAKVLNSDDEVIPYYEIKDNNDKTYFINIDIDENESDYISNIVTYDDYSEKTKLEDIIKDREFNSQTEVGEGYDNDWAYINYLNETGSYDLENSEINVTLNSGKLNFKQNNKEVTVPIENIKEVVIDGEDMTQLGNSKVYFSNNLGEVYYYDEIPNENSNKKLEETVKNYKKITLNKKIKNFVFRRNESSEYRKVLEILLKLEDNTLYSIKNNKVVDYLVSSNNNVNIYKNNNIEKDNKKLNYGFKSIFDMEAFTYFGNINYFVTKDDYLYDINSNKIVSNNKIDKMYKSNDTENCNYNYLIIFKNNETVGIGSYRCS